MVTIQKIYFSDGEVKAKLIERSILFDIATTTDGTNELTQIFGKKIFFENPETDRTNKIFLAIWCKARR